MYRILLNTMQFYLNDFVIWLQVLLGLGFRMYEDVMQRLNIQTKLCWQVNRGKGLAPVQSCEGQFGHN